MSNPLPRNSDATFVMAFEREGAGTFWEGHVRAFEFFGGVPARITYDYVRRHIIDDLFPARICARWLGYL